jgi:hypothetical protein
MTFVPEFIEIAERSDESFLEHVMRLIHIHSIPSAQIQHFRGKMIE